MLLWLSNLDFAAGGGTVTPPAINTGANVFIPLVFARWLDALKYMDYDTLYAAAVEEAATNAVWANRNFFGILRVRVRLVPAF